MKTEDLSKKCPKCGCSDKRVSSVRNPKKSEEAFYIPHIPKGDVGVIRCSECGYIFEYCKDSECKVEFKKMIVD